MSTPTPKHTRIREQTQGLRVRKILQAFLRANPEHLAANPKYRCPAGPGRRPVSNEGAWYDLDDFMIRRFACGDAVDAVIEPEKKTTKASKAETLDGENKK